MEGKGWTEGKGQTEGKGWMEGKGQMEGRRQGSEKGRWRFRGWEAGLWMKRQTVQATKHVTVLVIIVSCRTRQGTSP